jgi:hypothetical protein
MDGSEVYSYILALKMGIDIVLLQSHFGAHSIWKPRCNIYRAASQGKGRKLRSITNPTGKPGMNLWSFSFMFLSSEPNVPTYTVCSYEPPSTGCMHTHAHTHIYIHNIFMENICMVCIYTSMFRDVYIHTHIYAYIYAHIYIHTHIYTHTHIHSPLPD